MARFHALSRAFGIVLALHVAAPPALHAQTAAPWPQQPVVAVVPFSPGGSVDVAARIVMPRLAERLGQPVIVDNTVGASGTIATQRVIHAKPDGYTVLFGVASPVSVAPLVSPGIFKYDALKELVPVAPVAASPFVLVGRPGLPAASTAELVRLLRKEPGKYNFGTDGVGTSLHVTAEMIKQQAGLDIVHVPYKSGPQVLTDVAGGQLDLAVLPLSLAQAFVRDGKVRAFGVTSAKRWPTLPATPSLAETPEFGALDVIAWQGVLAPAATDVAAVDRLSREVAAVLADPDVVRRLAEAGFTPMAPMRPPEFAAYLAAERKALAAVIATARIRLE